MKNYRQELTITTETEEQFLNLTFEVEECLRRSMISEGFCIVMSQHTTSAVFLENDNEALYEDWAKLLNEIVPADTKYTVDYVPAAAAHIKQMLLGASVSVPISDGKLELGPRQYIMYGDFSGCREKTVVVKIIGE